MQDKLQFVNSVEGFAFDLTKIPFLKCLISIYRLIVEILNDQNLFTESNLGDWISSYIQFYSGGISQNELQLLLGRVEKYSL